MSLFERLAARALGTAVGPVPLVRPADVLWAPSAPEPSAPPVREVVVRRDDRRPPRAIVPITPAAGQQAQELPRSPAPTLERVVHVSAAPSQTSEPPPRAPAPTVAVPAASATSTREREVHTRERIVVHERVTQPAPEIAVPHAPAPALPVPTAQRQAPAIGTVEVATPRREVREIAATTERAPALAPRAPAREADTQPREPAPAITTPPPTRVDATPAAAVVHVAIGRVLVRVEPPTAPRTVESPARASSDALADYLAARSRKP